MNKKSTLPENNLELTKFSSQDLISDFKSSLSSNSLIEKSFWTKKELIKPLFGKNYYKTELHSKYDNLILWDERTKTNGSFSITYVTLNHQKLKDLVSNVEKEVKENALQVYNKQLESINNYTNGIFELMKNEHEIIINDKDKLIENLSKERNNFELQLNEIYQETLKLEEEKRRIAENKQNKDWLEAKWELEYIRASKTTIENNSLKRRVVDKDELIEAYKSDIFNLHQKIHNYIGENTFLKEDLRKLKLAKDAELNSLQVNLTQITQEKNNWKDLYEQSTLDLKIKANELAKLNQLNTKSKIKLATIATLSAIKPLIPFKWYENSLSAFSGVVLVGELTNYPNLEKVTWISMFLFVGSSVVFTSYKVTKYFAIKGINLFKNIRNKQRKEITTINDVVFEDSNIKLHEPIKSNE